MKINITYFAHGTTIDNEQGISSGWSDVDLSELGKKQSTELRDQIKEKFDVVFTSDLRRAKNTAKLAFPDLKIIEDKRLRECDYGLLTGSMEEETNYEEHITKPFPNGESMKDVETRIKEFLDYLKKNYFGKHIAIVAHKAPQLAMDVLLKGLSWKQAIKDDWRLKKQWQPGWQYTLKC